MCVMVCGDRCGCGAFCRRLFCRARPPDSTGSIDEDHVPVTLVEYIKDLLRLLNDEPRFYDQRD